MGLEIMKIFIDTTLVSGRTIKEMGQERRRLKINPGSMSAHLWMISIMEEES